MCCKRQGTLEVFNIFNIDYWVGRLMCSNLDDSLIGARQWFTSCTFMCLI